MKKRSAESKNLLYNINCTIQPIKGSAIRLGRDNTEYAVSSSLLKTAENRRKKDLTNACKCGIVLLPLNEGSFFAPCFSEVGYEKAAFAANVTEVPKSMRVRITLACTECKQRNYNTKKNKKNTPDRLELNKYCRFCKKHTLHRETK